MKSLKPLIFLTIIGMTSCQSNNKNTIEDNFESDSLNSIWSKEKFVPGALEIQSDHVRSGERAAKLTLRPGDQIGEEIGTELERAELREPKKFMAIEEKIYSYSFSLFLPSDFPVVPTRLVIAQWKQNCESGNCDPNNPVIALRYQSGEFRITMQVGPEKTTLYTQSESILNNWQDFKFNIRFSRKENGRVKVWMNNKIIVDYEGITAYPQEYGYPYPGNFYFKLGLYRDQMDQPMTIYIDDYLKKEISEF